MPVLAAISHGMLLTLPEVPSAAVTESRSEAVGDAIEAALTALGITDPHGDPYELVTIARRKLPTLPEGKLPPQIVISVSAFGKVEPIDATTDMIGYPVAVTIVTAEGAKAAYQPLIDLWRQRIRRAIQDRTTWQELDGWNAVETLGKEPFDSSALSKDFNFSTQVFTVEVLERRT